MIVIRQKLHQIIFESDTKAGRLFDIILLICILLSIGTVMLETIDYFITIAASYLFFLDWFFTLLFSLEYLCRVWVINNRKNYVFSFYGLVDFFSCFPHLISLWFFNSSFLLIFRIFRILRIFRIFKIYQFIKEYEELKLAMTKSKAKILVFLIVVLCAVTISGAILYYIEGKENGYSNIPKSIYWAIVTLTTVGYGDIAPKTALGQFVSSLLMILGYAIIAVPTGIVGAELSRSQIRTNTQFCQNCSFDKHDNDAIFCKKCGFSLKDS